MGSDGDAHRWVLGFEHGALLLASAQPGSAAGSNKRPVHQNRKKNSVSCQLLGEIAVEIMHPWVLFVCCEAGLMRRSEQLSNAAAMLSQSFS